MAAIVKLLPRFPALQVDKVPPEVYRAEADNLAVLLGGRPIPMREVRDINIPAGNSSIPARSYRPRHQDSRRMLVWYHGGGWTFGGLTSADRICRFLAHHCGICVLSVDYRLAPEHSFPAAPDDALTAYRFAVAHAAEFGCDPSLVAVGGDSAGGNLSAVVCHDLLAAHEPQPLAQVLIYPATDLSKTSPSYAQYGKGLYLTSEHMKYYRKTYVPDVEQRKDRRASPLLADNFAGLAPALMMVAQCDLLHHEEMAYAQRLKDAGVPVTVWELPGHIHAFLNAIGVSRKVRESLLPLCEALRTVERASAEPTVIDLTETPARQQDTVIQLPPSATDRVPGNRRGSPDGR